MDPYSSCGTNDMVCVAVELYQDGVLVFTDNSGWYYTDYIATFAPGDYVFTATAYYESPICPSWYSETYTTTSNFTLHVVGPNSPILPTVPIMSTQSGNSLCVTNNNMYFSVNANYANNGPSPTYSGSNPSFIWKKNGAAISGANNTTYTTNTLVVGDVITCEMTSSMTCLNNPLAVSNAITITGPVPPSVSIGANFTAGTILCPNTNVVFTATPTNGGTSPYYVWKKNGVAYSTPHTSVCSLATNTLVSGDVITCEMSPNGGCFTSLSAVTSNSITLPTIIPHVYAVGGGICSGGTFQLTTPTSSGTTCNYTWQALNNNVWTTIAGATSSTYTTPVLTTGTYNTIYQYRVIRNCNGCGNDTSYAANVNVEPTQLIGIYTNPSYSNPLILCGNTASTSFSTNSLSMSYYGTYTYQWQTLVGSTWTNIAGTNSPNYTTPTLNVGTSTSYRVKAVYSVPSANCNATSATQVVTVNPIPIITVNPPSAAYCTGGSQVFTASGATTYSWTPTTNLNTSLGATVTANPTTSKNYTVTGTLNGCSGTKTVGVDVLSAPGFSVSITSNQGTTICSGQSVTFSPQFSPVAYAQSSYQYEWKKNGTVVATTQTYTTNSLANADVISLKVISPLTCQMVNPFSAPSLTMTVLSIPTTPSLSISSSLGTSVCSNASVTFTATATNPGNNPTYQWKKNGVNISGATTTTLAFNSGTLSNNDVITCEMTSTPVCSPQLTTVSNALSMTVINSGTGASITITSNVGNYSCANTPVTFTATPNYGTYTNATLQWKKNGIAIAGATNTSYTTSSLVHNDVISCTVITNNSCNPVFSSTGITMNISGANSLVVPTITIQDYGWYNADNFVYTCSGNSVYLNTITTFAGTNPNYQWKKNGVAIGTNSPSLWSYAPVSNGDVITCEITSSLACAITTPVSDAINVVTSNDELLVQYFCNTKEACVGDVISYYADYQECNPCDDGYEIPYYVWDNLSGNNNDQWHYSYIVDTLLSDEIYGVQVELYEGLYSVCPPPYNPSNNSYLFPGVFNGTPPIIHYSSFTPSVTIAANNTGSPCPGNVVIFSATSTGGGANATYQWKKNGVNIPDATFKQVAFNNLNSGDIITCEMTSSLSCATPAMVTSNAITVSAGMGGMASLSLAASSICAGGTVNVNLAGGNAGTTYTWQVSTNGGSTWTNITGYVNTTNTAFSNVPGSSRSYRVVVNDPICGVYTTAAVALTLVADPVLAVTPSNNNFCAGGNTTLSTTVTGGLGTNSYQWQQYIGTTWTNIAGATGASYTASNLSATTSYRANLTQNVAGCAASTISAITVKPLPNITTNPALPKYCVGGTVSISAAGGSNYSWSPAAGLSVGTGTPVVASGTLSTTYSLTGTGTNGCTKTIVVPVTVNQDPGIVVTGASSVCVGSTTTLTATTTDGAGTCTIQWQKSTNGTTWSSISGVTGTTYTTPAMTTNAYYRATYTCNGGGCSPAAASSSLLVSVVSLQPVLSLLEPTICTGGTAVVNLTGGNAATTYTWQVSTNSGATWTNITGYVNTTNTSFSNVPGSSRSYQVIANDPVCGIVTTNMANITLNSDPVLTVTPSNNNFCAGGNTTLTTAVTGGLGTNSYQWQQYISNVWTNIAGATSASYTASNLSATTNYRANLTQSVSGCAAFVISAITVNALPNITTSPAAPTYCVGGTVSISAAGGSNYSWSPATGLSATTGSPVVSSGTTSTTYSLTGTGTNGCTKTISVPVTVKADPSITVTGPTSVPTGTGANLSATTNGGSGTCTLQWQSSTNGTTWSNISGATAATYTTPAITGTKYYRATYTCNGSGCSPAGISNVLTIIGIQPPSRLAEKVYDLTLFPNPASVNLNINVATLAEEEITFVISDMLGKSLTQWQGKAENGVYENEISIENFSQGVYFLSVKIGERVMTQKFVKE